MNKYTKQKVAKMGRLEKYQAYLIDNSMDYNSTKKGRGPNYAAQVRLANNWQKAIADWESNLPEKSTEGDGESNNGGVGKY